MERVAGASRVLSHRTASWRCSAIFDVPDNIAYEFNLPSSGGREKINADKFIFDQYHQLKLVQPVEAEIVS
jgi:hypothetical protein